jgi:hypothetical protein
MDKTELKKLQRQYHKNEQNNLHTENCLLLAKAFGSPKEVKNIEKALAFRNERGGYSLRDPEARMHYDYCQEIHRKHYPKLKESTEQVDEAKEDLSQYSTERLKAYHDKHWGGGVPTFGHGARVKRVYDELKRRQQLQQVGAGLKKEEVEQVDEAKYRDPKYLGKLHAPDAARQERERKDAADFDAYARSTDDFIPSWEHPETRGHDEKVPLNKDGVPYGKDILASRKDIRGRKDKSGVKRPFKTDLKAAIKQGLGKHGPRKNLPSLEEVEQVDEAKGDIKKKPVMYDGKKIGEIGWATESWFDGKQGTWYAKHYASGSDGAGFFTREEAEAEVIADHEIYLRDQRREHNTMKKINEKAVSTAQQQAAGIALAAKKAGKKPAGKGAARAMADMPTAELEKFAGTKHKGLPKHKAKKKNVKETELLRLNKKKAVKEADRPLDGDQLGPMSRSGRSKKVLESRGISESMDTKLKAAYQEGYAHGLREQTCRVKHYEDMEEAKQYYEGYKFGLDECYGMVPNRGLVDETMVEGDDDVVVQNMASFGSHTPKLSDNDLETKIQNMKDGETLELSLDDLGINLDDNSMSDVSDDGSSDMLANKAMKDIELDEADLEEVSRGQWIKQQDRRAERQGKKSFHAFGQSFNTADVDESVFESLDNQLNALLKEDSNVSEGLSVNISQGMSGGYGNGDDTVSVTATGDDADKLLGFIKQVGLGGMSGQEATGTELMPLAGLSSDYGAPAFNGHDMMTDLIKVAGGDEDYEHEENSDEHHHGEPKVITVDAEEVKEEYGTCNECGMNETKCQCDEEVLDETQTEDQMEYQVAEDDGEGNVEADAQGAEIDSALALATEDEEVSETMYGDWPKNVSTSTSLREPKGDAAVAKALARHAATSASKKVAGAGQSSRRELDKTFSQVSAANKARAAKEADRLRQKYAESSENINEWANEAGKDGTEASFERDIEFMTKVISGGLNKPKATGQQTIPVLAGDEKRTVDHVDDWQKLAGIKK